MDKEFKSAGITFLDPATFIEPFENPQDLLAKLTCGTEVRERFGTHVENGVIVVALYRHEDYHWAISVHLPGAEMFWSGEGFWVYAKGDGIVHGEPCKTFGEARALLLMSYDK